MSQLTAKLQDEQGFGDFLDRLAVVVDPARDLSALEALHLNLAIQSLEFVALEHIFQLDELLELELLRLKIL